MAEDSRKGIGWLETFSWGHSQVRGQHGQGGSLPKNQPHASTRESGGEGCLF